MEQERAVNKALMSMQMKGIVFKDAIGEARIFLEQVYTAGWDEGHHKTIYYADKEVYQCDKDNHILGVYKSATDAAKQLNCHRDTIYLAIAEKRMTRKGIYWKHREEVIEDSNKND